MKSLLSVRHWILFALMFGIQLALKFIQFKQPLEGDISSFVLLNSIGVAVSFVIFFIWIWSISVILSSKAKLETKLDPIPFKICVAIIILNTIATVVITLYSRDMTNYVLPVLAIITMALMIYCLLFTARSLKSIELGRVVRLNEYVGDFFLLFIFPIGVWFIQPRVNKAWSTIAR